MGALNFVKNGRVDLGAVRVTWQVRRKPKRIEKSNEVAHLSSPPYKLHLGPGPGWVKPSGKWLAVDVDPERADVVIDFHDFDRFPLDDGSVDAIYASHTFEHVSMYRIGQVMRECYRVLMPGGILRIVVPNPEVSIREYLAGNEEFSLFVRRRERAKRVEGHDLTLFECMKGDFVSRNHQPDLLGEKLAHQNAWDFESMKSDLVRAGFDASRVRRVDFQDIGSPDFAFEGTYPSEANERIRSLYVEAAK